MNLADAQKLAKNLGGPIKLNAEWTRLFHEYEADHQNPKNQACHRVGIPMILASIPLALTVVGLPLALPLFGVGWVFQFAGHHFEGKPPAFFGDRRMLIIGAIWWLKKSGARVELTAAA